MKRNLPILLLSLIALLPCGAAAWQAADSRLTQPRKGYRLNYTFDDKAQIQEYDRLIRKGVRAVKVFFGAPFPKSFDVVIHPGRASLDSTWQRDWLMPDFKSECWMVASGVGAKIDLLSPRCWAEAACEHDYSETLKTQQLITHELIHVFHGQFNESPDFASVEGIDWLVEGIAAYASGQCDSARMAQVRKAVLENKTPSGLDGFWTGKLKYGLSGSLVMYLDQHYGREKLKALLPLAKRQAVLDALQTTEADLLREWKAFILG